MSLIRLGSSYFSVGTIEQAFDDGSTVSITFVQSSGPRIYRTSSPTERESVLRVLSLITSEPPAPRPSPPPAAPSTPDPMTEPAPKREHAAANGKAKRP
jgi:hypothetical protein